VAGRAHPVTGANIPEPADQIAKRRRRVGVNSPAWWRWRGGGAGVRGGISDRRPARDERHASRLRRPGRGRHARRTGDASWAVIAVLLGGVCGGLATAARTGPRDGEPLASLTRAHAEARVELTVHDDPRRLAARGPGPPTFLVRARLTRLVAYSVGRVALDVPVIVFGSDAGWLALLPGQRVGADVRLAPARGGDLVAAAVTASGPPLTLERPPWAQSAAGRLRAGLQLAAEPLPDDVGGLLPGLVIGDTSRLDPAVEAEFRATGLTHLTAVSGANVAIVLGVVVFLARWLRGGPWVVAGVCAVALVGFVILARPSPSVVRAAIMGGVALLALATGRARAAAPALAVAVLTGLVIDPGLAVDAGFALSVLATAALVLVAPRWRDRLRAAGVPAGAAEAIAVPAAAQVACAPVVAALSGSISLVAVPANLLAVPAVAPATVLGVGAAVVSPLWPPGAAFLAWLASWPTRWLVGVARLGAGLPAAAVPWPAAVGGGLLLALVTVAVVLLSRWRPGRLVMSVGLLAAVVGAVPVRVLGPGWPPDGAVVVACDVGQGDAVVLPVRPGRAVVVDTGPEPVGVDDCLRRLEVDVVSLLAITHFHADHIGGIGGVMRGRRVLGVVLPTFDEPAQGERLVRAAAPTVPVVEAGPGWSYVDGNLRLRLVGPASPVTGTRSDPNNNSLVLRAGHAGVSMLLGGDAEIEEQEALLAEVDPGQLRAHVFKVPHHGSAYQDHRLFAAVDAEVALISVGSANRYGHPSPAVMDRLRREGARVFRTDMDGDVAVVVSAGELGVVVRGRSRAPP
jgi:competence protein ComEC